MINLYNANCLNILPTLAPDSIDLIITDPPYGVEFSKGFDDSKEYVENQIDAWVAASYRVLKPTGHAYLFIPTKEAAMWLTAIGKVFQLNNIFSIRSKTNITFLKNNFKYDNQLVAFVSKGKSKLFNEVNFVKTSDAWLKDARNKNPKPYTYIYPAYFASDIFANDFSRGEKHPTAKNVDTLEILIKLSSNEGDIVLDPFMGGGSTGEAAIKCGRKFVGIELNPTYYNMAEKRLGGRPHE